eukprot:2729353-Alexandrium_andersonii.AAC.1
MCAVGPSLDLQVWVTQHETEGPKMGPQEGIELADSIAPNHVFTIKEPVVPPNRGGEGSST